MIYGYIRVSTDKQTVENQRFEINEFTKKEGKKIDFWIEETISGNKEVEERKLGAILKQMKKGDVLICAELSRLGRNLLMIMGLLNQCMKRGIKVWTIKDNYRLGNDISSKVLAFAFGLSAEIERNLISQRTKEALARKRAEGKILGRPKGSRSKKRKLTGKEEIINKMLAQKSSICSIARKLKVHRLTVTNFIKDFLIKEKIIIKENSIYIEGKLFFKYGKIHEDKRVFFINEKEKSIYSKNRTFYELQDKLKKIIREKKSIGTAQLLSTWQLIRAFFYEQYTELLY